MPVKRRQNLAKQTGDHITKVHKTTKLHFTMVMKVIMMMRVIMKIMNNNSYQGVLSIVTTK